MSDEIVNEKIVDAPPAETADEEMTSVQIATSADLRDIAGKFGIECPAGKGRLPSKKVRAALVAAGIEIIGTEYFPATVKAPTMPTPGTGKYVATIEHTETEKVFREGISEKTGKPFRVPTKEVKTTVTNKVVTLTVGEIRAIMAKENQVGRVSHSDLRSAFERHYDAVVVNVLPAHVLEAATAISAASVA